MNDLLGGFAVSYVDKTHLLLVYLCLLLFSVACSFFLRGNIPLHGSCRFRNLLAQLDYLSPRADLLIKLGKLLVNFRFFLHERLPRNAAGV